MISFALCADLFIIFAVTDPAKGRKGFSSFLVEKGRNGFKITPHGEPMGLRGNPHGLVGRMDFNNCKIPLKNIIGELGSGLQQAFEALDISRLSIGVSCLGLSQRFLEMSIQQAKSRITFGKPIAQRQVVQQMIADMATNIAALRALVTDVTLKMEKGIPVSKECAMCKLFGIKTVREASDAALEIHGGIGYTRDLRIERMYRDARGPWLEEGTPAVQRTVIAKEILAE
jgi:alkylation response protein AidB-like acyl-CoA dehydrogenase